MKILGWVIGIIGVLIIIHSCVGMHDLRWSNPDATERRLWIDHPDEMWWNTAELFTGTVLMIGSIFAVTKND